MKACDERRKLKSSKHRSEEDLERYREAHKTVRRKMKNDKENWISQQCSELEENIRSNNTRKAFELVKQLCCRNKARALILNDKNGNTLTNAKDVRKRWKEYCYDLYNVELGGDQDNLSEIYNTNQDLEPDIEEVEVEMAIKSLPNTKTPGGDSISTS